MTVRNRALRGPARLLRLNGTETEDLIWFAVRNRRLGGLRFVRQFPIGPYIVDFCCRQRKLVVEIDGGQHGELRLRDDARTAYLELQGYRVIRFWNHEVAVSTSTVLEEIWKSANESTP
ncbi:MAG: endonuclease domain-containing protein [SAR202 cluster bacterium]|nr:endonuclease domain-containing protein [SAR202 cluster bacterium]